MTTTSREYAEALFELAVQAGLTKETSEGLETVVSALMQTPEYIYLMELKKDQSAAVALQQIEDKGYALPFAADPRPLFKIGLNFNTTTRKIDDWKIR